MFHGIFMKDKKHIDQLFKDRFENFEATPSPEVWQNIQTKLKNEKEDRKVIPIWWKLAGVAALLALLFTIGNTVFNSDTVDTEIVTTETSEKDALNNETEHTSEMASEEVDETTQDKTNRDEITDALILDNKASQEAIRSKEKSVRTDIASENTQEKTSVQKVDQQLPIKKSGANQIIDTRDAVALESHKKQQENNRIINKQLPKNRKVISGTQKDAIARQNEKTTSEKIENNQGLIKKDVAIETTTKTAVSKTDTKTKEVVETKTAVQENKKSIFDVINKQNTESTEEAVTQTNAVDKRWDVAPNFAPVYYGSLDGGSSIDPSLADNTKNGNVNFSYGVQVSYTINDRLSVRSGVSNVDLSYGTGDVEIGEGPVSSALRSINYGGKEVVTTAADKGTFSNASGGEYGAITTKSTSSDAQIIQNIKYYEVPLELKYVVVNKRIGVNLIGGFSTLFLGGNSVSVSAQDFNSVLGEANNLSSVSFTTNVGFGFDYQLSSKFKFNIEPMFKYQLNPYTDSSVGFKPYYVGVYTALSLRF